MGRNDPAEVRRAAVEAARRAAAVEAQQLVDELHDDLDESEDR